jgi:hypothetical protein
MVNATDNARLNQTKSLFLKKGKKFDSYVLELQIKEIKLGTATGAVLNRRVA